MGLSLGEQSYLNIEVTFKGPAVSGPQHLLEVNADLCGDGCTPKMDGLDLKSWNTAPTTTGDTASDYSSDMLSFVSEKIAADYNNCECGRRGKSTTPTAHARASPASPAR